MASPKSEIVWSIGERQIFQPGVCGFDCFDEVFENFIGVALTKDGVDSGLLQFFFEPGPLPLAMP